MPGASTGHGTASFDPPKNPKGPPSTLPSDTFPTPASLLTEIRSVGSSPSLLARTASRSAAPWPRRVAVSQRMPSTIPIRLVVESDGLKLELESSTVDLSFHGVKVRTPFVLLPGETVGIVTKGDIRHAISARVVWAQRAETDLWSLAGLEFLETPPT